MTHIYRSLPVREAAKKSLMNTGYFLSSLKVYLILTTFITSVSTLTLLLLKMIKRDVLPVPQFHNVTDIKGIFLFKICFCALLDGTLWYVYFVTTMFFCLFFKYIF